MIFLKQIGQVVISSLWFCCWRLHKCNFMWNRSVSITISQQSRLEKYFCVTIIKSRKSPKADDYHTLTRDEQVILLRLRTGHNRLNQHMCRKLKLAPSTACQCQQGDQTSEHILQTCPRLHTLRESIWPDATPLQTKLFGERGELERTAKFVRLANIRV